MTPLSPSAVLAQSRPFCVDAGSTTILANAADYRERFHATPAMALEGVFAVTLIERLMARADADQFILRENGDAGLREFAADGGIGAAFALMLDRVQLCRWLADATGMPPLRGVVGSINQASTHSDAGLIWHDDLINPSRMLGIVVNLTSQPYDGGIFEMRRKGSTDLLLAHQHDRPGSALIFAVRPDLEHRVTPLISGGPRRVFAGWFLAAENHPVPRD